MTKYVIITLLAIVIMTLAFFGVRGSLSRKPPLMFFDDMDNQPKYKSQAESAFFADGRTMRMPPAGAIAWGRKAAAPDPAQLVDDQANYELKALPVKLDLAVLTKGQKLYETYCTVCHGGYGDGQGVVTKYGSQQPASYHTDRLRQVTDGYLYKVVTEGKGLMGGYGPSIKPEDRWAVVAYVRALQRAGEGSIKDVPENLRSALEKQEK